MYGEGLGLATYGEGLGLAVHGEGLGLAISGARFRVSLVVRVRVRVRCIGLYTYFELSGLLYSYLLL